LLPLEGDLLIGWAVGAPLTSSCKTMKRSELLLRGGCEVVVELVTSVLRGIGLEKKVSLRGIGLEKKVSLRDVRNLRGTPHFFNMTYLTSCEGTRDYIFVYARLGHLYTRLTFLVIAIVVEVFISCLSFVLYILCYLV
jgi:hypothetical protein